MALPLLASTLATTASGTMPAQMCVVGATKLDAKVDGWPKNPLPDAWVKVMLGRAEQDASLFCQTPRIDNADSAYWNFCCALPQPGSKLARIGGTYYISVWDADVTKEEGDLLGEATLSYDAAPGQYLLQLEGGVSQGAATLEIIIQAQPSPPPPPLAVPPSPPAPPPLLKQVCILAAKSLPEHYDMLDEEGGLPLNYLVHKGLDESAPFHRSPEPWVMVEPGPVEQDDPAAYRQYFEDIGNHPGGAAMIQKVEGFGHFKPIIDKRATTLEECRTPLHLNEASPRWAWCCDFTGMADGAEYVFQLFDEDAYLGYTDDDFLGYATLPGDAAAGKYDLDLKGGAFARRGGKKADGTLQVEIILGQPQLAYDNYAVDCWEECGATGLCDFCGPQGACCRDGFDGLGCPSIFTACADQHHCCMPAIALPPPSQPPPPVIHVGEYCLDACGGKEGPCDFCGEKGSCCTDGDFVEGCPPAGSGAPFGTFGCVETPVYTASLQEEEQPNHHFRHKHHHQLVVPAIIVVSAAAALVRAVRKRSPALEAPPTSGVAQLL